MDQVKNAMDGGAAQGRMFDGLDDDDRKMPNKVLDLPGSSKNTQNGGAPLPSPPADQVIGFGSAKDMNKSAQSKKSVAGFGSAKAASMLMSGNTLIQPNTAFRDPKNANKDGLGERDDIQPHQFPEMSFDKKDRNSGSNTNGMVKNSSIEDLGHLHLDQISPIDNIQSPEKALLGGDGDISKMGDRSGYGEPSAVKQFIAHSEKLKALNGGGGSQSMLAANLEEKMLRSSHGSQREQQQQHQQQQLVGGSSSSSSSSSAAHVPDGTAAGAGGAGRPLDTQEDTYGFVPHIAENEETMALHLHAQQNSRNKQLGPREEVGPRFGG